MHMTFRTRRAELTEELKAFATEKITRLDRFFVDGDRLERAEIQFSEERNPRIASNEVCEVTLHGSGHHVRAKASSATAEAAVDLVIDKLEHQLTKLKRRTRVRDHGGSKGGRHAAPHHGLPEPEVARVVAAHNGTLLAERDQAQADENACKIVKRKQFDLSPMSTDEAALRLDLLQHDFFLFTNAETGRSAVLYRRSDGHLGLIDAAA